MTRHLLIFFACFLAGAAIVLVVRTARHDPYAEPPAPVSAMTSTPLPAARPAEVAGPVATVAMGVAPAPVPPAPAVSGSATTPVNTVCALCGMAVDPKVPTAIYRGKVIGFGCRACPPTFAAHPDFYGPAALENRVEEGSP